jgi:hypothetical protein
MMIVNNIEINFVNTIEGMFNIKCRLGITLLIGHEGP